MGKKQGAELVSESTHFFVCLFRERERERASWVGSSETRRERIPSRLCTASMEPDTRLEPTSSEILT